MSDRPHNPAPITAIVIFRNEREDLERCLPALRWCDEVLCIDMASEDGSPDVATRWADRLLRVEPQPIAEPTRVAAARLARHDWVLLVDPDEVIPPSLAVAMREALRLHPDAGAFSLPMRFYFKRRPLTTTIWGTITWKQRLIHRRRCDLLPWCNRLTRLRDGFRDVRLPHDGTSHMEHYWSESYRELFRRHVTRYCHTEAKAMAAEGRRYTFLGGVRYVLDEMTRTVRHFEGWRDFPRGWLLSGIYGAYVAASVALARRYARQPSALGEAEQPLPELREAGTPARRAA